MYHEFDDMILGAETMVTLPAEADLQDQPESDVSEADAAAQREGWARRAIGSNGFGAAVCANDALDDDDLDMRDVIRHIFALNGD
jgi:hypothetical protein